MSTWRRRAAQLLALISAVAGLLVFATTGTGQAEVPPITDYSGYPPSLPAGCADGPSALVNVQFSANGVTSPDLYSVRAAPGELITMSWDGFAPGCEGIGVGISSKVATVPVFDQNTEYWLYEFSYCGPEAGATPCAGGGNQLTLRMPPASEVPCYQLDAHVGPPLGQVGPDAAYYGPLNGVQNLLISAQNGGTGDCGPLPPCPTNPDIPAVAFLCAAQVTTTTTTTAPTTTTTAPTTTTSTTAPPPVATSAPQAPVCATNPALPADSPDCVACPTNPALPAGSPACAPVCASNPALPATSPDCVPCATNPSLPAGSPACVPVSTSAPSVPSSTPTTATAVQAACAAGEVRNAAGQCAPAPVVSAALPVTGRDSRSLASTGGLLVLSGLCMAYAYGRRDELADSTSND